MGITDKHLAVALAHAVRKVLCICLSTAIKKIDYGTDPLDGFLL